MKKFLKTILFLCAISSLAYSEDNASMSSKDQKEAMDILERMREKIEKEEAEKAKLAKQEKEAREREAKESQAQAGTNDVAVAEEVESMVETKKVEEPEPKTEAEKLERTRKKAMDKLDFYERVVRSVAREEAEIAGYYEIMGEEKARPSIMDEQTNPAEVPQTEAQTSEADGQ